MTLDRTSSFLSLGARAQNYLQQDNSYEKIKHEPLKADSSEMHLLRGESDTDFFVQNIDIKNSATSFKEKSNSRSWGRTVSIIASALVVGYALGATIEHYFRPYAITVDFLTGLSNPPLNFRNTSENATTLSYLNTNDVTPNPTDLLSSLANTTWDMLTGNNSNFV